jgi:hypothetical protein
MVEIKKFHCKCRFGIVRMFTRTPPNLDLYLQVEHRQIKTIDAKYNVRVGYWALRNNMQQYKVYATVIRMLTQIS